MPPKRKYDPASMRSSKPLAVQARMNEFEMHFKLNGGNATQAAIEAGYSPKSAKVIGAQLVNRLNLRRAASEGQRAAFENSRLTSESVLKVLENIVHFDPGEMYDKKGRLIPLHKMPEHVRKGIASMDVDEIRERVGRRTAVVGHTYKPRQWDKLVAVDKAMKHLGLFERDNRQKERNLTIQVGLVSSPRKDD